ncbi:MAG TPA: Nramp family divalent metal transporter [Bryobacteraceae bacterium]|nr:Nramp family divalent metal transporter [Bryobacteraceae bacterium]
MNASTTVNNSLPEVHSSVPTAQPSLWRRMFAFAGPAYLVSVGYMDPGNWATDLEGGARFGYALLWVLVLSNLMAILLQTLSARLGIVSQRDLAQACRETYPRPISYALWILSEIAIAACDLAEVLGAAIALNLLFHIPLLWGVLLTAVDTLLLLLFTRLGIRVIEAFVLALISTIAICFAIEIVWAGSPVLSDVARGVVPHLSAQTLYIAIGILGATVMPHNLYLHSALVQTRRIGKTEQEKRVACRFNLVDSTIALNGALLVNAAILILAALAFYRRGIVVTEIQQASQLLTPLMGTTFASIIFGVALLCSGQSSTLTGTMAGQIVMEGFLNIRMRPWLRRLLTRTLAIIPAALTVYLAGETGTYKLLILSQVILSLQLPFAVIPLIHFTNDKQRMGALANRIWVKAIAWLTAVVILGLNIWLADISVRNWLRDSGAWGGRLELLLVPLIAALSLLLLWVIFEPILPPWLRELGRGRVHLPEPTAAVAENLPNPVYRKILVPLDHTSRDRDAISHAAAMAKYHNAKLYLLHVEEGVTSQLYGPLSSTAEVEAGDQYLQQIVRDLESQQIPVEVVVRHARTPTKEIVRYARELAPDLVVMGAHGHKGLKDIVFGTTINAVRHKLKVPLLIVRGLK